ncbi:hypothetical protein pb186bvf_004687 [Paramecium bursaria]
MKEILILQVGQAGNSLGQTFWEELLKEHKIGLDGKSIDGIGNIQTYFQELQNGMYSPRALIIDNDTNYTDQFLNQKISNIFDPNSILTSSQAIGNNYAYGYLHTPHLEIIQEIIRMQVEKCDTIQGVQMIHSVGGGCGSGLGARIIEYMNETYPDLIMQNHTLYPAGQIKGGSKLSMNVLEPYNMVLGFEKLNNSPNLNVIYDNQAMFNIVLNVQGVKNPTYKDYNKLFAQSLSGTTSTMRFAGEINASLRTQAINLIPFPSWHFITPSISPIHQVNAQGYTAESRFELIQNLFNQRSYLCSSSINYKNICAQLNFRGLLCDREIQLLIKKLRNNMLQQFIEYIPESFKMTFSTHQLTDHKYSASMLINSLGIYDLFTRELENFRKLYNKKAYLYKFLELGLEESQVQSAQDQYQDYLALIQEAGNTCHGEHGEIYE